MPDRRPHIALVGAFPFPLAQGSQIFARDQALALVGCGAEITVLCYGNGEDRDVDLPVLRTSHRLTPRSLRSGPSPAKPIADAALLQLLITAHRRRPFDAILAHNAEAACVGITARPWIGVPVVYVAHTLLGQELSRYSAAVSDRTRKCIDAVGRRIDIWLARFADCVIALGQSPGKFLAPHARAPIQVIPPGLTPGRTPCAAEIQAICKDLGLVPGRFALYSGNLDPYQDLTELASAARAVPGLPIVVATHAPREETETFSANAGRGLRVVRVHPAAARKLTYAAGVTVLPRKRPGGFPVKLLNYMEASRAIVARKGIAEGLEHGHSAWLLSAASPANRLGEVLAELIAQTAPARRLGQAARQVLDTSHQWPDVAARTLAVVERAIAQAGNPRPPTRLRSPRGSGDATDGPGAAH